MDRLLVLRGHWMLRREHDGDAESQENINVMDAAENIVIDIVSYCSLCKLITSFMASD